MIRVERLPEQGEMTGGHAFGEWLAFSANFPAAQIVMYDDDGVGITMSRDQAIDLIAAIQRCLRDA